MERPIVSILLVMVMALLSAGCPGDKDEVQWPHLKKYRLPRGMTQREADATAELAWWFYQSEPDTMSWKLHDVLEKMLFAVAEKSSAMDDVPRPPFTLRVTPLYMTIQAVKIAVRNSGKQNLYEAARIAVAAQYSSEYHLAKDLGDETP